jgi:D-arginine dehydrogenase
MATMSSRETDILIVGAGIAGASTAYHLQRSTDRPVLILDKESTAGVHSSGRNASFIREKIEEGALQPLLSEGAAFLRSGQLAHYHRCGLILLGAGEQDASRFIPQARGTGLWCPQDGVVDVAALLQSYLLGQEVRWDTEVLGWAERGAGLVVSTSAGDIACQMLVNAAGPWAGQLGNLPLTPKNRHIFTTPPLEWADPDWPFVWDVQNNLYFRPESGGLLLSCCDEKPAAPGDYEVEFACTEELAEKLATHQPGLGALSIQNTWVGQRVFAPDDHFVIGFDPRDHKIFHVGALGGHGITSSYAVGRIAAEMIGSGTSSASNPFDPARLLT